MSPMLVRVCLQLTIPRSMLSSSNTSHLKFTDFPDSISKIPGEANKLLLNRWNILVNVICDKRIIR